MWLLEDKEIKYRTDKRNTLIAQKSLAIPEWVQSFPTNGMNWPRTSDLDIKYQLVNVHQKTCPHYIQLDNYIMCFHNEMMFQQTVPFCNHFYALRSASLFLDIIKIYLMKGKTRLNTKSIPKGRKPYKKKFGQVKSAYPIKISRFNWL